ncbi:transcription antiterminator [Ectobacillus sp. SYSU M60031]|uniref:Transcription antiterminator n=1 Tax=Ectobacillus ponti TaxID=2961894 RepID=A0AA41X638_9BACI|nr:transcription antiterminator [Ectobacillus ponti]
MKDLADHIAVSVRTIHRDLKNVEDILQRYGLQLQKKSGVGIQIVGNPEKIHELELFLFSVSHVEYTPEERQTLVLCTLLEAKGPVKLIGLATDLHVTIATVSNDLTKLETSLTGFGLTLLRRRGYGVELSGPENAKRRVMRHIIAEHMDESEFLSLAKENIQKKSVQQIDTVSDRLMGLVERNKLLIVEKAVESINADLSYSIADSAYIGLVVHLALAIERIQQGESIMIDPEYLAEQQTTKEYRFAEKLAGQLERAFEIEIPSAEIGYITMHLRGAKLRHDKEYLMEDSSLQIALKTKHLIQYVGERLEQDLTGSPSLFEGLVLHLKPALYRMKQGMGISNPLLEKIKGDYPELFAVVAEGMEYAFPETTVPDEEIGYLVMHFGAAVLGRRSGDGLRVLVICSSGIGTSKMLASRLQREFAEIKSVRNISVFELNHIHKSQYDLVVSTIPLPNYEYPYIMVSPILSPAEVEKMRNYIQQHTNGPMSAVNIKSAQRNYDKDVSRLQRELYLIREYADVISTLLQRFEVGQSMPPAPVTVLLPAICGGLLEKGIIADLQAVVQALLRREEVGGLGIPGTSLVLFHTRDDQISIPFFGIYPLDAAIEVKGMDNIMMEADTLLMLLSPGAPSPQAVELLSHISSLLIENETTIALFESHNYSAISAYLTTRFDHYFSEKLKEIRSV